MYSKRDPSGNGMVRTTVPYNVSKFLGLSAACLKSVLIVDTDKFRMTDSASKPIELSFASTFVKPCFDTPRTADNDASSIFRRFVSFSVRRGTIDPVLFEDDIVNGNEFVICNVATAIAMKVYINIDIGIENKRLSVHACINRYR